jgi:hypothetical protein
MEGPHWLATNPTSSYMEGVIKLMNRLLDMEEGQ